MTSSCESLLKHKVHAVFAPLSAILATVGNCASVLLRALVQNPRQHHHHPTTFHVLLSHLGVSDAVMGVYLAIIGVADRLYEGNYVWEDTSWRVSTVCTVAAFLFLLSVETSTVLTFLVSVERAAALWQGLPLCTQRFKASTVAHVAGACCWVMGAVLSMVPLLVSGPEEFSSQSSLCVPIPYDSTSSYARYVMDVNVSRLCVVHTLVVVVQAYLFLKIFRFGHHHGDSGSVSSYQDPAATEGRYARRFTHVAVCRALFWLTVGMLGWVESRHSSLSNQIKVAVVVVVIPLGGPVLHPFLYAYAIFLERRRQVQHERLMQYLKARRRAKQLDIKNAMGARH